MTETILGLAEVERLLVVYKPLLRRAQVIALCEEFGYGPAAARKLMDGQTGPLQPIDPRLLPGRRRYRRDEILQILNSTHTHQ